MCACFFFLFSCCFVEHQTPTNDRAVPRNETKSIVKAFFACRSTVTAALRYRAVEKHVAPLCCAFLSRRSFSLLRFCVTFFAFVLGHGLWDWVVGVSVSVWKREKSIEFSLFGNGYTVVVNRCKMEVFFFLSIYFCVYHEIETFSPLIAHL